jgi:hypothetical protein
MEYQVDYDRAKQVNPDVNAWYPECNYNTHVGRYLGVVVRDFQNFDTVTLELRLVKSDIVSGAREIVDRRYDTWVLRT